MKGIFSILFCMLLLTGSTGAQEPYADIFDLWNNVWAVEAMPDWVCSVSSTDGSVENLTVIVNSAEAEAELRSMLADDSTLTVIISETAYTDNQLQAVRQEIVDQYMNGPEPIVHGVGVGWTSIDGEVSGFGESGKESRVVVNVLPEYVEEYAEIFREKYGDMVYVEGGGYAVAETAAEEAAFRPVWPVFLGTALVIAAAAVIIGLRRRAWKQVA